MDKLLNSSELDDYATKYQVSKDKHLLNAMINTTQKLSYALAYNWNYSLEDINYIHGVALMKALNSWDKSKGATFSTYFTVCAKNEIRMEWRRKQLSFENRAQIFEQITLPSSFDMDYSIYEILLNETNDRLNTKKNVHEAIKMYIDGYGAKEIIDKTHIKRTTLYSRIRKFKKEIGEVLNDDN